MKMKKNKNNKQDPSSIIGGTIAVPDTMDISCRSDLTLDLQESPRPRKKLDIMLPPLSSRDADESTSQYSPPQNGTIRRDYYDDANNDTDIDKIAERAAYNCFGADADQKMDVDGEGRPIRRGSTLVAENSAIDGAYRFVICVVCIMYVLQFILNRYIISYTSFCISKSLYICSIVVCCTGADESPVIRTIPKRNGYQLFLPQQFEKA